jgi:hypothetical protein
MIWYPICYTILVLPLSIVRWRTFRPPEHQKLQTPFAVTAVVVTIFGLSGVVNVALIMLTRRNLLLFGQRRGVVSTQESRNANEGSFGPGSIHAVQSGVLSQGATGERVPTASVISVTLPGTSLDHSGDHHEIKCTRAASSNWGSTSTHHALSVGVHSIGDLSEPMKFGATPSLALRDAAYSGSTRNRKPLPDFELRRDTSELSHRVLKFPDEREWERESNHSLNNVGMGESASVRMEQRRRRSLELEDVWKTKSAPSSVSGLVTPPGVTPRAGEGLDQSTREQEPRSTNGSRGLLSHPLDPGPSLRDPRPYSSSQLGLHPPAVPPIPSGSPPRPSSLRGRGAGDLNVEGGVPFVRP